MWRKRRSERSTMSVPNPSCASAVVIGASGTQRNSLPPVSSSTEIWGTNFHCGATSRECSACGYRELWCICGGVVSQLERRDCLALRGVSQGNTVATSVVNSSSGPDLTCNTLQISDARVVKWQTRQT